MQIILLAATPFEIAPTIQWLEKQPVTGIQPLIGGVGCTATAWALGQAFHRSKPDLVINAGIAGAFDRNFAPGEVLNVVTERFGDLGVEEADGRFSDLFDMGLLDAATPPFINGRLENPAASGGKFLPAVHGITVNKVHGTAVSIELLRAKYPEAQVETMEGAAVFYACTMAGVPFLEIRSISNYVEPRNRDAWHIPLAIERLNEIIIEMIRNLKFEI